MSAPPARAAAPRSRSDRKLKVPRLYFITRTVAPLCGFCTKQTNKGQKGHTSARTWFILYVYKDSIGNSNTIVIPFSASSLRKTEIGGVQSLETLPLSLSLSGNDRGVKRCGWAPLIGNGVANQRARLTPSHPGRLKGQEFKCRSAKTGCTNIMSYHTSPSTASFL